MRIRQLENTGAPEVDTAAILQSQDAKAAVNYCEETGRRWPAAERFIKNSTLHATNYAIIVLKAPWPAAEPAIMQSPNTGIRYLRALYKEQRCPEFEKVIENIDDNPKWSADAGYFACWYANTHIKQPWSAAEDLILNKLDDGALSTSISARELYNYIIVCKDGEWPEFESTIQNMARSIQPDYLNTLFSGPILEMLGRYAAHKAMRNGTRFPNVWPELSQPLAKKANASFWRSYCYMVLNIQTDNYADLQQVQDHCAETGMLTPVVNESEAPQLDPAEILKAQDANKAVWYCQLNGDRRWPAAERFIKNDPEAAYTYAGRIIKGRFPAAEFTLANSHIGLQYAIHIIKHRWPECEDAAFEKFNSNKEYGDYRYDPFIKYAEEFIQGRWPELERHLLQRKNAFDLLSYAEYVLEAPWPAAEHIMALTSEVWRTYCNKVLRVSDSESLQRQVAVARDHSDNERYERYKQSK